LLALPTTAPAQARHDGRRATPDQPFRTVWVVDRTMAELEIWRTLIAVTSSDGFQPVVLHGGEDRRWTRSLEHLLGIVPQGDSVWVSDRGTVFDVDETLSPTDLGRSEAGPAVYSSDPSLDDVAALIAMRLDGVLTVEPPTTAAPAVFVGVDDQQAANSLDVYLPNRAAAVDYANRLAGRPVVMVVREGDLLPEHVLWAFQRDAKIVEVEVLPYSIDDLDSEIAAVAAVRDRIHRALPLVPGLEGGVPEALVIAGDWHQIPFRFARSLEPLFESPYCDNGFFEYAADAEYANLDGDPWGEPEVPVGRLMSPYRDLLALQSVIGIWREHGAFAAAADGVFVGLLGGRGGLRDEIADRFRAAFPHQLWTTLGPEEPDVNFHLDRESFFAVAGRSEIVLVHGHGHPDSVSPAGSPFNLALSGGHLVSRDPDGIPAFWFFNACSTGKPDHDDGVADQTLLVGLQSRLAYGSLMAVETVGGSSNDLWWPSAVVDPDLAVGELVRRGFSAAIAAYRDGGAVAGGMPTPSSDPAVNRKNAFVDSMWIGDPLTPVGRPAS
jgi:hypothetical protein